MEPSQNRRRETQTRRQTAKTAFGDSQPVPKVVSTRPRAMYDIQPRSVQPLSRRPQLKTADIGRMRGSQPKLQTQPKTQPSAKQPDITGIVQKPSKRPHSMAAVALAAAGVPDAGQKQAPTAHTPVPARYMPPMDMELPGEESPLRHIDSLLQHGKLATWRRWTFRGAVAMIIFVIVGGGLFFYLNLQKSFGGTAASLKSNADPNLLRGEKEGRINVLLLGRGGSGHDGPDLTDTMMLDSIDVVNHTSTLISIPRDLWVDIPNEGTMKINAAFETGEFKYLGKVSPGSTNRNAIQAGFDQADQTVESVLGVTIHYNVLVDFHAFQEAVDTVNGVTVKVPTDLVDPTMAWENGHNPVLAKAGTDNFNGKQALNYVRSRETTSDFARSQRQRAVLVALKSKVESIGTLSNPFKLLKLFKAFSNNVQTDLSINNAQRLHGIVRGVPDSKTASVSLSGPPNNYFNTGTLAGQAIALPSAGLFNYKNIQAFIRTQLKDPYIVKEHAKILILNGTDISGLATKEAKQLKAYGYNVVGTANAPTANYTQTLLIDLNHAHHKKYTKRYLEQRLGVSADSTLPDSTIKANGANFVIILGSDEAVPSQI